MKKRYVIILTSLILLGCQSGDTVKAPENVETPASVNKLPQSPPLKSLVYWSKLNHGFLVRIEEEHPKGLSISTIRIFPPETFRDFRAVEYADQDPISDIKVADLDKNGFSEIYIITQSAGSGSYEKVIGLVSVDDKFLAPVRYATPELIGKDPNFTGYMGHDNFELKDGFLVQNFPVYKETDIQGKPTGGNRSIYYSLDHTADNWNLKITHSELH